MNVCGDLCQRQAAYAKARWLGLDSVGADLAGQIRQDLQIGWEMMNTATGEFQFMQAEVASSLYRNGQVLIQRDSAGNTASAQGIELESHTLQVIDARQLQMTCDVNGFELVTHQLPQHAINFLDHHSVVSNYYGHCADLVAQHTGAQVYAFDHNVRSAGGQADKASISGGQDVQGPAHIVHGDYTLRSAPERVAQLANPPSGNDTLRGVLAEGQSVVPVHLARAVASGQRRFAIINVWRNIDDQPVATHPLALCDSRTVVPENLVVFELHYPDRIGENYFSKFADAHRFYYYPAMTTDEALLIKQWDSAGRLARSNGQQADDDADGAPCTFSFHTAFDAADTPADAPDRWSIEVRCLVIYPEQE